MIEKVTKEFTDYELLVNEPLKKYTFTQVGGAADFLFFPKSVTEIKKIIQFAQAEQLPWLVLGNASNLIVRDGGIRGFVIMLNKMDEITTNDLIIKAQAGAKLVDVSLAALNNSLTGLEFACGIPGSVGGAVFMNAGAYGGEISQVFVNCEVLLSNGTIEKWDLAKMNFGYRKSLVQEKQAIVLNTEFALHKGAKAFIEAKMAELNLLRKTKQPLEYPSCGSVFKRPPGHFTGKLIQEAGLQGKKMGGAQVSTKHAGFIVNINQASASDYEKLINYIIEIVQEKFGVTLHPEVKIIGEKLSNNEALSSN